MCIEIEDNNIHLSAERKRHKLYSLLERYKTYSDLEGIIKGLYINSKFMFEDSSSIILNKKRIKRMRLFLDIIEYYNNELKRLEHDER